MKHDKKELVFKHYCPTCVSEEATIDVGRVAFFLYCKKCLKCNTVYSTTSPLTYRETSYDVIQSEQYRKTIAVKELIHETS